MQLTVVIVVGYTLLALTTPVRAQEAIQPVDFRPFVDGHHWIVRQPLFTTRLAPIAPLRGAQAQPS